MEKNRTDRESSGFGAWLNSQILRRGMNQREFARTLGVGTSTVSRWIGGRIPEASLIERIADVLVLDYDLVATKAGYRPRELMDSEMPEWEKRLRPLMQKVQWTEDLLRIQEANLRAIIETQKGR